MAIENNSTDPNTTYCRLLSDSEEKALGAIRRLGRVTLLACYVMTWMIGLVIVCSIFEPDHPVCDWILVLMGVVSGGSLVLLVGLAESDTIRLDTGGKLAIASAVVWAGAVVAILLCRKKLEESISLSPVSLSNTEDLENPESAAALEQPTTPPKEEDMEQAPHHLNAMGADEADIPVFEGTEPEMPVSIRMESDIPASEALEPDIPIPESILDIHGDGNVEMDEPEIHLQTEEEYPCQVQR